MSNLIEIKKLSKCYYTRRGEVKAIDDISFKVSEGTFLSIVGSSGCGKSTLLNIIAGLDEKTSGEILFKDDNIKIGYMLQDDALLDHLSVFDNAILGLKIKKEDTKENRLYVKKLLETYGLKDFINKYPHELSGGMKQRVALIRTLSTKPDLLLLDEPFSALDYQSRLKVADDVYNILKKEKKTAIMISHDIAESVSLSDEIIVLSKSPAVIKNHYNIELTGKSSPISNRSCKEFSKYYNMIWRDLDEAI